MRISPKLSSISAKHVSNIYPLGFHVYKSLGIVEEDMYLVSSKPAMVMIDSGATYLLFLGRTRC